MPQAFWSRTLEGILPRSWVFVIVSVLFAASVTWVLRANADQLSDLVARTRTASGPGLGTVNGLHLSGTINTAGISGKFDRWVDLTTGAYSYSHDAGPLSGAEGFDGQSFWMHDAKGVVLPQNAPYARHGIASEIFQGTEALYRPNYGGAQITYLGSRQDHGRTFDAISFLPAEGKAAQEWWFDANTNLLARKVITRNGMTTVTEYSDYQSVGGLMIAHKIVVSQDTGPQENADVTAAVANPLDLTEHVRRPASSANDFALSGETTVPVDIIDHHIYIDLMLNGKGPFHFIFDTGGRNMVDPTVAYQIGAQPIGSWRSGGVGPHATVVQFTQIDQVQIGSATLSAQPFEIRELGPRTNYGWYGTTPKREMQGLIGYELPARFIVTIDYAGRRRSSGTPTKVSLGLPPVMSRWASRVHGPWSNAVWPALKASACSIRGRSP